MVNRLYKLSALFFLLFSGFSVHGRGGLYHINRKNERKAIISATTLQNNPLNYEYILNNIPMQVINLQQHRGAHSLHAFTANPNFYTIRLKYINFVCGGSSSELSRFRKLILYPFHAFW
jgi:hypothetical protein